MADEAASPAGYAARARVNDRPSGVTVLAVVFALFGFLTALGGVSMIVLALAPGFTLAAGLFYVLVGLAEVGVAYGLWKGIRLAWFAAVVLEAIAVVTGVLNLLQGEALSGVVSLLVAGVIVWYLLKPEVQAFFGVRFATPWSGGRPT